MRDNPHHKKDWKCGACTYINIGTDRLCVMCNMDKFQVTNENKSDHKEQQNEDSKQEQKEMEIGIIENNESEEVKLWLKNEVKLPQYIEMFINDGYDSMISVESLSDLDLIDIGVTKKGHRKKILILIARHQNKNNNNNNKDNIEVEATENMNNSLFDVEGANVMDTAFYKDPQIVGKNICDTSK